jgi:multicomponent K+:H+ antiporter subunit E
MSRILPYPLLAVALLAMWLLLQQSLGLGHILLGSVISILACLATALLGLPKPRIGHPFAIIKLAGLVGLDVMRSNLAVCALILRGNLGEQRSMFLHLPLELKDRYGLAVLACIITATPGSAWLEHDLNNSTVLIHLLDQVDEDEWIHTIKSRYEKLLLEIFT